MKSANVDLSEIQTSRASRGNFSKTATLWLYKLEWARRIKAAADVAAASGGGPLWECERHQHSQKSVSK